MLIHTKALAQHLRAESQVDEITPRRHRRYMVRTVRVLPHLKSDYYLLIPVDLNDISS